MFPFAPDQILLSFAILVVSVTVHEAAHAWTADLLGDPTASRLGRVSLDPMAHADWIGTLVFPLLALFTTLPLIGWGKPIPVAAEALGPHWRQKALLIAAAGPVCNLGLACAASLLLRAGVARTGTGLDATSIQLLSRGLRVNVMLALLNLLPLPPLDAGNLAARLLPGSAGAAVRRVRPYGAFVLCALLVSGVFDATFEPIASTVVSWLD